MNDHDDSPLEPLEIDDGTRALYEKAKREFTEADAQKYLVEEEMFPFENLIEELEEISRREKMKDAVK
jgi:hypothetical protein